MSQLSLLLIHTCNIVFQEIFNDTFIQSCGLCEGVEGMKPHDTNKCWDVYPNCADVAKKYCYQPQIARDCCISCGLGKIVFYFL